MMVRFYLYITIFIISCNQLSKDESLFTQEDLILVNGIAYSKKSNNTISGKLVQYFDDGKPSSEVEYRNGIPNGQWSSFGYEGELIQEGIYFVNMNVSDYCNTKTEIFHYELSTLTEGEYSFLNISIWVKLDKPDTISISKYLLEISQILNEESFIKYKDIYQINFNVYNSEKEFNQLPSFSFYKNFN